MPTWTIQTTTRPNWDLDFIDRNGSDLELAADLGDYLQESDKVAISPDKTLFTFTKINVLRELISVTSIQITPEQ